MATVKRKCCRSKPKRCADCPVVALRMARIRAQGLRGKKRVRAEKAARNY
jgi:hypothetical protein